MFATFVICVGDFSRGEVLVKVGVMEFGLTQTQCITTGFVRQQTYEKWFVRTVK